ncbi:MAG TPA: glutamate racemase [Lutibacter sp.]|nr:glutamate racemase [Lutibacter sp.]
MLAKDSPIGFFDSGVGGTSIWKEMIKLLPNENTIYFADSANAPYGKKSQKEIIALSEKNTEFLLEKGCKLIVVACNTATTNAITHLREKYSVPFVGIEPAIKPAALHTKTNSIGILATQGTLSSALFAKTSSKFASNVQVIEQVGTGLVALIEAGKKDSPMIKELLDSYLKPMKEQQIDHLILGCTHYPYLIPIINTILGNEVRIIDSGYAVSKQINNVLLKNKLLNTSNSKPIYNFFTNTTTKVLRKLLMDVDKDNQIYFSKK